MSLLKSLDLFGREKSVVTREQMRHQYTSFEYILSKAIAEFPLCALFSSIFAATLKRFTGLRTDFNTLWQIFTLMAVEGTAMGYAVGSVTSDADSALSLGMPLMIIFMCVGVINPSGVDKSETDPSILKVLKLLSPVRWTIESLCLSEFRGMKFVSQSKKRPWWRRISTASIINGTPRMGAFALVRNGDQVLDALGLGKDKYTEKIWSLKMLTAANFVFSWIGLSFCKPAFVEVPNDNHNTDTAFQKHFSWLSNNDDVNVSSIHSEFLNGAASGMKVPVVNGNNLG